MRLSELIKRLDNCEVLGMKDAEVTAVSYDSRSITPEAPGRGAVFAALSGAHVDGRAFIKDAVSRGAVCVITDKPSSAPAGVTEVIAADVREALSTISSVFYGEPAKRLKTIGVTGTNGKTTTTYLIESVFKEAGLNAGVIGTVNYRYGDVIFDAPHTTPQAPELQRIMKEMADSGVTHLAMEVSSHALEQKRVSACRFDAAVFTNLTHEHLDYHKTMDEYFRCKSILFKELMREPERGVPVVNIDDPWGKRLSSDLPRALAYSLETGADVYPEDYRLLEDGIEASVITPQGKIDLSSHLVGEYNLQNILASVAAGSAIGLPLEAVARGIAALRRVPGRLEKIDAAGGKKFRAYVDYAHTGDALERALLALKRIANGRVITVFGCGGDRDRKKRPVMGEIAARLSDVAIITSDNPRGEDPLDIIREVEEGIKGVRKFGMDGPISGKGFISIPDRREAIRKAVSIAEDNDTIFVAGKGHEDYQIVKGERSHFNDTEEIKGAMNELWGQRAALR